MKKALFIFAAAATMLASCQIAEEFAPKGGSKTFEGIIETEGTTRVALAADGDVYHVNWQKGDKVIINDVIYEAGEGGSAYTFFIKDTTYSDPEAPYEAYYPVLAAKSLPAVQNYVEGAASYVPMMAESNTQTLSFKNICAILKLNVSTSSDVMVKSIVLKADQPLSGQYVVINNAAVIAVGKAGVTINCDEGVSVGTAPKPFFVSVPAGDYTNLTITLNTTDGKAQTLKLKSGKTLKIERSKVYESDFAFNNLTAISEIGGVAVIPEGKLFNAALKQLVDPLATETTIDNDVVKIVFDTKSTSKEGVEIQDIESDLPIYASFDEGSGIVTISTPAETIKTGTDASYLFGRFTNLEEIVNLKCLNTEDAEVMNNMFWYDGCDTSMLKKLDLSNFNTTNVTTFRSMFCSCKSLETLDVSSFDTKNAENFQHMFRAMSSLKSLDLTSFNTENVSDFSYMFYLDLNLKELKQNFNTENASTLSYMFYKCWGFETLDLSNFNTENITNFTYMFFWCRNLTNLNLTSFDTSSATTMAHMFNSLYSIRKMDLTSFSLASMAEKTGLGAGLDYFIQQCGALEEVHFGEDFKMSSIDYLPYSTMWCGTATQGPANNRTGQCNNTGKLDVYCCQDVADWLAYTSLRWVNTGYSSYENPVPVHFIDPKTQKELQVVWRAD